MKIPFPRTNLPLGSGVSAFLFGPRMVGKTTLLQGIPAQVRLDFLDPEQEFLYRGQPGLLRDELAALEPGSLVVIDEVQKIPELLNVVQMAMDRQGVCFVLSGSSARKLRRGGANMLGGRALDLRLHPLTAEEMGDSFSLENALAYGTLPRIATLVLQKNLKLAQASLRSYSSIYLKEEIQAEALTRNLGAFQRFLAVAAQSNAQIIEFSNVARECSVPASTVKEYFQILEDTLLGFMLWPHDRNERKKARPKQYFFDCGVVRAMQGRLAVAPTAMEQGFLFETWMINELVRLRDYAGSQVEFSLWRKDQMEIDIVVSRGGQVLCGIECKTGRTDLTRSTIKAFQAAFPGVPIWVASMTDARARRLDEGVEVLSWKKVLERFKGLAV